MSETFDNLIDVVARLRAPDGCPWDRKQTHDTLKTYLVEETYEVLDTIDQQNTPKLREELGDVLLQVLLHAQIEAESNHFTIRDVTKDLTAKLIRRHPHVFEPTKEENHPLNADTVVSRWEQIKKEERQINGESPSILDSIPKCLPALQRAYHMQKRASRVGFDWTDPRQVIDKLDEELNELREATIQSQDGSPDNTATTQTTTPTPEMEHEFGDVLFTMANIARFLKINPEEALRKATNRFASRFQFMEAQVAAAGQDLQALTLEEWDQWWEEAKRHEHTDKRETPITS